MKKKVDIAIINKNKIIAKNYKLIDNKMKRHIEIKIVIYIIIILNNVIQYY